MNEYKYNPINMTPFKWFVLENFPFIEEDFDSITSYGLWCKLKEYFDKVATKTNEMGTQVESLTNAFIELKNYVDNYFKNLDVQDEINNKLDEMVQDGTFELIVGKYLSKKLDYFKITPLMNENEIIDIIENDNPKVIEFEKGEYTFSKTIHITSNTIFLLNGSTLKTSNNKMFLFYKDSDTFVEYEGVHNVKFLNGNIGISSALMHNSNIEFKNINFIGNLLTTHAIQIAGSKDITIDSCYFNGIVLNDTIGDNTELIQLETCTSGGQPYIDSSSVMFNNLGNYNIIIKNCIFDEGDGVNTKFYVGIGHHSRNNNNLYSQQNIKIKNNSFKNPTYSAISIFGLNDCIIENNNFEITNDYTGHIMVRFRGENKNVKILNNNFISCVTALDFVNVQQNNDFIIQNNNINSNKLNSSAIVIKNCENCKIDNNVIRCNNKGINIITSTGLINKNIDIENNDFINLLDTHDKTINVSNSVFGLTVINNKCKQLNDVNFLYYVRKW